MDMVGGSKRIYVPARNGLPERRSKTDGGSIKGRGQDTPVLRSSLKTRACLAIVRFICLVRTLNFAPQNLALRSEWPSAFAWPLLAGNAK